MRGGQRNLATLFFLKAEREATASPKIEHPPSSAFQP